MLQNPGSEIFSMMMMMIWCFTSLLTLFKSYWDKERMIMKDSEQEVLYSRKLNSATIGIRTWDLWSVVGSAN